MPKGFFAGSLLVSSQPQVSTLPKCGQCKLSPHCTHPKRTAYGKGGKGVLILVDAPTAEEDETGKHWVGGSMEELRRMLAENGLDAVEDCWVMGALACHPGGKVDELHVDSCRPTVVNFIKQAKPKLIILFGYAAIRSVISYVWKEDPGAAERWVGWRIPHQKTNCHICPTWHPAEVKRRKDKEPVIAMMFRKHLKAACKLAFGGRPWDEIPDWERDVEVVLDHRVAAEMVRKVVRLGGATACDYETNMLKPDAPDSEIITFSICWRGKKTFAFPWHGEVIKACSDYLYGKETTKIASNLKFEDRWTRRHLGHPVRGWAWDTMIMAHVIDNRTAITSIKFQAFVLLGADCYDDHINQFLKSAGGRKTNLAKSEIDLRQLLIYNGLDSLLEFKVAEKQAAQVLTGAHSVMLEHSED